MEIKPNYIQDIVKESDWSITGETGITTKALTHGNWLPYKSPNERQSNDILDSNFCVTFHGHDCLIAKMNYFLQQNQIPADALKFFNDNGYIVNGTFDFNECFNATLNGTSKNGNSIVSYWESLRNVGVIPQARWTQIADGKVWEDFVKPIPQELLNLGKMFLRYVTINYDWVLTGKTDLGLIQQAMLSSPLLIAIPVCVPWVGFAVFKPCGLTQPSHSVALMDCTTLPNSLTIKDSYDPYIKSLEADYYIVWAIRHEVQFTPLKTQYNAFLLPLQYGQSGPEVAELQTILKNEEGLFDLVPNGVYGPATAKAVLAYQIKHGISPSWLVYINQGRKVGNNTRLDLNKRYS